MASKKELKALLILAGKVDPSLQTALRKASKDTSSVSDKVKKSGNIMSKMGSSSGAILSKVAKTAAIAGGVAAAAIAMVGKKGIETASDLTEVQNVVDTTFGPDAKNINVWSQEARKAFGLSTLQAKQFTGTMGAMLKSSGITGQKLVQMSTSLSGLTGDFASFYNLDHEEAFTKIRAGISGETEPLKQIGINMSVANLEAYALSKGIKTTYEKMDEGSKMMLRYNYLLDASKDAQGDFAKTLNTSFANQKRLLMNNAMEKLGQIFEKALPFVTKYTSKLNQFLDRIDGNALGKVVEGVFGRLESFLPTVMDIASQLMPAIAPLLSLFNSTMNTGFTELIKKVMPSLVQILQQATPVIMQLIQLALPLLNQGIGMLLSLIMPLVPELMKLVQQILPILAQLIQAVFVVIQPLIPVFVELVQSLLPPVMTILQAILPLLQAITPIISALAQVLSMGLNAALKGISPIINKFANDISFLADKLSWLLDGAGKLFGLGGKSFDVTANLKEHATGGFSNRPAIFGEAGLEAAIPIKPGNPRSLSLLNQTSRMLGVTPSGGGAIQLTYAPVISGGNRQEIEPILQRHKEEIRQMLEEIQAGKVREAFGY